MKEHLQTEFEGTMVPFEDERLSGMTDLGKVRKVYKLNGVGGGGGKKGATNGVGREGEERRELEVLVLGAMALRGATN
jgi:EKC/KEOPS complex subunit CGI121/TPRKB